MNIHYTLSGKVNGGQATRIVLNLDHSNLSLENMKQVLKDNPIRDLEEIIIVKDGKVTHFFPFED